MQAMAAATMDERDTAVIFLILSNQDTIHVAEVARSGPRQDYLIHFVKSPPGAYSERII